MTPSIWAGDLVRLRAVEPEDWVALRGFTEQEERLGDLAQPPRSAESHRRRVKEQSVPEDESDRFVLAVEAVESGEIVGAVGSHLTDTRAGWFEYGVSIGAEHRRKGYAAQAALLLMRFLFEERRYHKCVARVFAHNEASLRLQRRLGFVEEGRLRDQVFVAGRHRDLVVLGLLAEEYTRLHTLDGAREL
ncbi:GNAT family protein [Streptomyces sp. NPDC049954]|uniref:GNAT family N-acetyltransferase n=1 Tax=Streptomyces sp. NPDC049954 TaxID=3155779 RepID=UPI00342BBD4D